MTFNSAADRSRQLRVCERILVVITEDWFALSHFRPLLCQLRALASEVVVATRSSGRLKEIEALGVRAVDLDMRRGSFNPLGQAAVASNLAKLIDNLRPDVVHAISLQPMLLTGLAAWRLRHKPGAIVLHITGLGYIAASRSRKARLVRQATFALIRRSLPQSRVWLLAENPDDIAFALSRGIGAALRTTIIPGAGVDREEFAALPPPSNAIPRAAYVGRLIRSKGVETLVEAQRLLAARGVALDLVICGAPDASNPDRVTAETLADWRQRREIGLPGHIADVRVVWAGADIAAVPTLGGEGIPRALLEAAACARPIVASDVPGCRHFVRDGVEGFLVAPGDPGQLADRLERLAADPALRARMGAAARERFLSGYTTEAVEAAVRQAYASLSLGGQHPGDILADRQR